jgi:hypothetical protein
MISKVTNPNWEFLLFASYYKIWLLSLTICIANVSSLIILWTLFLLIIFIIISHNYIKFFIIYLFRVVIFLNDFVIFLR